MNPFTDFETDIFNEYFHLNSAFFNEKDGSNGSSTLIQRGANWRVKKQSHVLISKAPGALTRKKYGNP